VYPPPHKNTKKIFRNKKPYIKLGGGGYKKQLSKNKKNKKFL
jgi:hypothetical protein